MSRAALSTLLHPYHCILWRDEGACTSDTTSIPPTQFPPRHLNGLYTNTWSSYILVRESMRLFLFERCKMFEKRLYLLERSRSNFKPSWMHPAREDQTFKATFIHSSGTQNSETKTRKLLRSPTQSRPNFLPL